MTALNTITALDDAQRKFVKEGMGVATTEKGRSPTDTTEKAESEATAGPEGAEATEDAYGEAWAAGKEVREAAESIAEETDLPDGLKTYAEQYTGLWDTLDAAVTEAGENGEWGEAIRLLGDYHAAAMALIKAKEALEGKEPLEEAGEPDKAGSPEAAAEGKAGDEDARTRYDRVKTLVEDAYDHSMAAGLSEKLVSEFDAVYEEFTALENAESLPDDALDTIRKAEELATALLKEHETTDYAKFYKLYTNDVAKREKQAVQLAACTRTLKDLKAKFKEAKKPHDAQLKNNPDYTVLVQTLTPALIKAIDALLAASSEHKEKTEPRTRVDSSTSPLEDAEAENILALAKTTDTPLHPLAGKSPGYVRPIPPVGTEDLKKAGLKPKHTISTPGQKIHVSEAFDFGGGRLGCIAYVESDGEVHIRSFYRSNSRGDWQSASGFGKEKEPRWIGKGVGDNSKSSTVLPILVQKELNSLLKPGNLATLKHPTDAQDVKDKQGHEEVGPDFNPGERYFFGVLPFRSNDEFGNEMELEHQNRKLASTAPEEVSDSTPLSDRVQVAEKDLPNFDTVVDRFPIQLSEHYGAGCEAFVFDGEFQPEAGDQPAKQLRYMFIRDSGGRVFLSGLEDVAAPTNSFGVSTRPINTGILGTGLIEYAEMMDDDKIGQYKGEAVPETTYVKVDERFHKQIPLIHQAQQSIAALLKQTT